MKKNETLTQKLKDTQEIEFKWSVQSTKDYKIFLNEVQKLKAILGTPRLLDIHDYYLDTSNHMFSLAKTSCRLRNENEIWELTLKARTQLEQGLAQRREKTYSLPSPSSFSNALQYTQQKILKNLLGSSHLKKKFEIKNERLSQKLTLPDQTQGEICFDQALLIHRDQKIPLQEIELEFLKGNLAHFLSFIKKITQRTQARPAQISKVATALKKFSLDNQKIDLTKSALSTKTFSQQAAEKVKMFLCLKASEV
ncbi:MAG: CYTH domain-containing protein [Chlamydiae bacterium]|nr:CYTH domain-containing protein [Chlamydiota bacterium]MBI3277100.1 CYTH domain-containing protein [Chlamydiota bacterium]